MVLTGPADTLWRLSILESVESTSDIVIQRAQRGEEEGLAVLAHCQTLGRGRRGRVWVAPPGNLNLSVLLRPDDSLSNAAWALLAAVVFHDALAACVPAAPLSLKWPNDVMLGSRKMAGLLVETASNGQGNRDWLVLGMGANLRHVPPALDRPLACLADSAPPPAPETLVRWILNGLSLWRGRDIAAIRAAWLARAHPLGTVLTIPDQGVQGRFAGLDDSAALLLEVNGALRRFDTGDVMLTDAPRPVPSVLRPVLPLEAGSRLNP